MNDPKYKKYYLFSLIGVLLAASYPSYMGVKVLIRMAQEGAVPYEEYPKYIIPYTPIAVALIIGTLLFPIFQKLTKRFDVVLGSVSSVAVFLIVERFMETKVLVLATGMMVRLEGWQMSLCYVPPQMYETRTWEAVDVLLGGYSPLFKLHFYLISVVIIVSLLNSIYGFGRMILTGEYKKTKVLVIQSWVSLVFLGMCIWACFTAFYRTGEMFVSPLSAVLMGIFFVLIGVTMGVFAASFTLGKRKLVSTVIPTVISMLVTTAMYYGEMSLLDHGLYRFGRNWFFKGLGMLVLAPVDIVIILIGGVLTAVICCLLNRRSVK